MTSRILNRFNIKTDRLLRSLVTDKLSCDIHPRKMIKMVRRVSRDHIIIVLIIRVIHGTKYLFLLYGCCMELFICSYYTGAAWN